MIKRLVNATWHWLKQFAFGAVITILQVTTWLGIVIYFINYIGSLVSGQPSVSPLDLAAASGGLCGLILLGAFYQKDSPLETELKSAAKLLLASTISFMIAFFLLEFLRAVKSESLNFAEWIVVISTDIAIVFGGLIFATALTRVLSLLKKL